MTYREKWIYLNILLLCLWWWYYPPMIFSVFCLACHQRWMSHWCNIRRCHTSSWLRVLTVYAYAFETMFYKQCCQPDFTAHWYICRLAETFHSSSTEGWSYVLRWFKPWPISDKYSNFAPITLHVSYKITTLPCLAQEGTLLSPSPLWIEAVMSAWFYCILA